MKYDEEIVALQTRVDELEAKIETLTPATDPPSDGETITAQYLETLDIGKLGELYNAGEITAAQFGAAFAGRQVKTQLKGRVAELEGELQKLGSYIPIERQLPASTAEVVDPLQKTSGDGQVAGDWTQTGDGTGYPDVDAAGPNPSSPVPEHGGVIETVQAYAASDGKRFTNLPPMKMHQRGLDAKAGGGKDPLQMPGAGGDDNQGGGDDQDPAAVVAEHGPANEVHVSHDRSANQHHVHSEHEDGHVTESDHASSDEAHDHAKALASEGAQPEQDETEGAEYE